MCWDVQVPRDFSELLHQLDGSLPDGSAAGGGSDPLVAAGEALASARQYGARTNHTPRDICGAGGSAAHGKLCRGLAAQIFNAEQRGAQARSAAAEAERVATVQEECVAAEVEASRLQAEAVAAGSAEAAALSAGAGDDFLLKWMNRHLRAAGRQPLSDFNSTVRVWFDCECGVGW